MEDPLSELIKMICNGHFVFRDTLVERLKDEYGYNVAGGDIEDCVRRFLYEKGLSQGLEKLVGSWSLSKMAKDKGRTCSRDAPANDTLKELLIALGVAFPPELNKCRGARFIRAKVSDMRQDVENGEQDGRMNIDLRSTPLNAWTYVEKLLKVTIQFYEQALSNSDQSVNEAFAKAREEKSLRPILQKMRSIENKFKDDRVKQQSYRVIGRPSPFANFDFDKYDNDTAIDLSRNFYAHEDIDEIEEKGLEPVKQSLLLASSLVGEFIRLNIAPSIIFLTAHGWDAYDRDLYLFVTEDEPFKERRLFRLHDKDDKLLKPYLTISPIEDVMVNPPVFPFPK